MVLQERSFQASEPETAGHEKDEEQSAAEHGGIRIDPSVLYRHESDALSLTDHYDLPLFTDTSTAQWQMAVKNRDEIDQSYREHLFLDDFCDQELLDHQALHSQVFITPHVIYTVERMPELTTVTPVWQSVAGVFLFLCLAVFVFSRKRREKRGYFNNPQRDSDASEE